jgi:hypothetical protein
LKNAFKRIKKLSVFSLSRAVAVIMIMVLDYEKNDHFFMRLNAFLIKKRV